MSAPTIQELDSEGQMGLLNAARGLLHDAARAYNATAAAIYPPGCHVLVTLGRARVCLKVSRVGRCMDWKPEVEPAEVFGENVLTGTRRSFNAHDETAVKIHDETAARIVANGRVEKWEK